MLRKYKNDMSDPVPWCHTIKMTQFLAVIRNSI